LSRAAPAPARCLGARARACRPRTRPPRLLLPHAHAHAEDASRSTSPYHRAATRGPTGVVRPRVPPRRHRSSVRWSLGSTCATYKEKSPYLTHWSIAGAFSLSVTPPLAPQQRARGSNPSHHRPTTPTLSLGSPIPPCVACCSDCAALSPELRRPRLPPPSSAA
jgi:hypothetical protein